MNGQIKACGLTIGGDGPFTVIAGPCVAESRELCLEVAQTMSAVCRKLGVQYVFKASFDKANRSSGSSFRGPGMDAGLACLQAVKDAFGLPVVTDVHESVQVPKVAEVADFLQIPAFLCRQTDLLLACARSGKPVNVKKGQFMAPEDMRGAVEKLRNGGATAVMVTERGSSFGYHNLVVDMRGLAAMRAFGVPIVFDGTHSVQLPGGLGNASGGQREYVPVLARAAAAVGIDALFLEVHPDPDRALSDGPNSLNYAAAKSTIEQVLEIHELAKRFIENQGDRA